MRIRSTLIVAACFLATLFLSACGSSAPKQEERNQPVESSKPAEPTTTAAPAPAPAPTQPDGRPLIVTFGDSLTAGVSGKSYPSFLQDELDAAGYRYRVENQGVSGDTTTDGLSRIDNVIDAHPSLVVLEFGGNDGLRGLPVASTKQNLAEMIEKLKAASIPLVLAGITLPPNYGADYVKSFTSMYPELAKKYNLRFLPFLLVNVYQKAAWMQPDGIHPNEQGNKVVARDVLGLIHPLLKR
jgi:acyl-CoA thioesterase I